jgi:hypothetical protein
MNFRQWITVEVVGWQMRQSAGGRAPADCQVGEH